MGHMIRPQAVRHIEDAVDASAKRAAFSEWFGLRSRESSLLYLLFQGAPHHVSATELADHFGLTMNCLGVHLQRLRSAMNAEAIDYAKGQGYRLTEVGLEETREAMLEMARSLVA